MYRYYLDESGNTGDLIKDKFSLKFGGQSLFSLACVGIDDEEKLSLKINELREEYNIQDELKSTEIYKLNPNLYLDLVKYLTASSTPIFVELVDKKYCLIANLINSLIIPAYDQIDETNNRSQLIRNHLADYMWHYLPIYYLEFFNKSCIQRTSSSVMECLIELQNFFSSPNCVMVEKNQVTKLIGLSISDFDEACSKLGEEKAVEQYLPIPDLLNKSKKKSKIKNINILPHVHSFFNIIGRLNKYHLGDIKDIYLFHDEQREFDVILEKSKVFIVNYQNSKNAPPTNNSDLNVCNDFGLSFVNSDSSPGVQVADLLAGFYVRFINDVFYEEKTIDQIYFDIFKILVNYQNHYSPLGVNLVLPHKKQQRVFSTFGF